MKRLLLFLLMMFFVSIAMMKTTKSVDFSTAGDTATIQGSGDVLLIFEQTTNDLSIVNASVLAGADSAQLIEQEPACPLAQTIDTAILTATTTPNFAPRCDGPGVICAPVVTNETAYWENNLNTAAHRFGRGARIGV